MKRRPTTETRDDVLRRQINEIIRLGVKARILAKVVGVNEGTISRWRTGEARALTVNQEQQLKAWAAQFIQSLQALSNPSQEQETPGSEEYPLSGDRFPSTHEARPRKIAGGTKRR